MLRARTRRPRLAAIACGGAALALSACGGGGGGTSTETRTAPAGVGVGPSKGTLVTADATPVINAYLAKIHGPKAALIVCPQAPAKKYELMACKVTLEEGKKAIVALRVTKFEDEDPVLEVVGLVPAERQSGPAG